MKIRQFFIALLLLLGGVTKLFAYDVTIYAKYGGNELYLWAWTAGSSNYTGNDWYNKPAMSVKYDASGNKYYYYKITVPSNTTNYQVVFCQKKGNGTQTANSPVIAASKGDVLFDLGTSFSNNAKIDSYTTTIPTLYPYNKKLYLVGKFGGTENYTRTDYPFTQNTDGSYSLTVTLKKDDLIKFHDSDNIYYGVSPKRSITGGESGIHLSKGLTGDEITVLTDGDYTFNVVPYTNDDSQYFDCTRAETVKRYYLKGSFDGWGAGHELTEGETGVYSVSVDLSADEKVKLYCSSNNYYSNGETLTLGASGIALENNAANMTIGTSGRWTFTIDTNSGTFSYSVDASEGEAYYFMSELSNYQPWECFRLSPSRKRYGGANSTQFFTIHIQDFLMDKQHHKSGNETYDVDLSELHWYIYDKKNSVCYYPDKDYELGSYNQAGNNSGEGVIYQTFGTQKAATPTYKFKHTKGFKNNNDDANESASFTVMFNQGYNSGNGEVAILINPVKNYCGKKSLNDDGYYLVGNFGAANANNELKPWDKDYRRKLTKYYYYEGLQYTAEQESLQLDSIVYRVTVPRPAEGWKNLFLVVFPSDETITNNTEWPDDGSKTTNWKNAIRPQVQWWNGSNDDGLDATARRGGLFTRRSDAADTQQALNPQVSDEYNSYTFSMNVTTSTYNIVFNKQLFLMGPAVSAASGDALSSDNAEDSDASVAAWSSEHPALQTQHALIFVEHDEDGINKSYRYYGGSDTEGTEQKVYLVQGQRFAFVWDKNFADAFYAEDDVTPMALVNEDNGALDLTNYRKADNDRGNYDTQYVNYQSVYALTKPTFNPKEDYKSSLDQYAVDGTVFNLPTGEYYIRLYLTTIDEHQYYYYTVGDRSYDFYSPGASAKGVKEPFGDFSEKAQFRTFSDYHAVVIPDGIKVKRLHGAARTGDTHQGTIICSDYTLETINGKKVLPANTAVLLVNETEASTFLNPFATPFEYYGANPKLKASTSQENQLKPSVASESIKSHVNDKGDAEGTKWDNFLFGYKLRGNDTKYTIGFYYPGEGKLSINSAYLQVDYNLLGVAGTGSPYFVVAPGHLTDINFTTSEDTEGESGAIYTLDGRKVATGNSQLSHSTLPKGIYVMNGKKFVVK